jgi:hypothetical protein
VSTNSTTRVTHLPTSEKLRAKKIQTFGLDFGAKDRARTGHPDLGKVVLYQMSYFRIFKKELFQSSVTKYPLNELIRLRKKNCFFGTAKIGIAAIQKNIFYAYLYCGV